MEVLISNRIEDPSQTIALRNAFVKAMNTRFNKLRLLIAEVIVDDDAFGLITNRKPGPRAFAFPRSADKVSAFMRWLREQAQENILQVTQMEQVGSSVNAAWSNMYIQEGYKKGIQKARTQLKGVVPSLATTGGVEAALMGPFHADRLGLLYTRVFNDLKGITDAMDTQISRVLAEGITSGQSLRTIARHLNKVISGKGGDLSITDSLGRYIPAQRRAELLARTEIIRAHAEAQLQEFQNWRVAGVSVMAELVTTKDKRTCSKCSKFERQVFTIEEARGIIPIHPACRCIWVPFIEKKKNNNY